MEGLPYLTTDLAGIGGKIKSVPEDFFVEEIPSYAPCGDGSHVYLTFEKVGMTTLKAIDRIAQSLGMSTDAVGYAGLKDAHAVTRQTISINNTSPERAASLKLNGIRIIAVNRHKNKLKLGHLAGNRFVIKVRDVTRNDLAQAEKILYILRAKGVPNYFGEQRFGVRGNSHRLGLALIRNSPTEFLSELLGRPHPNEILLAQQARAMYDAGDIEGALAKWPPALRSELTVLQRLVDTGDEEAAMWAIRKPLKRLYVSAYQSFLFNQLLAERLATIAQVEWGDVVYIHSRGPSFVVKSVEAEQPRVDAFEISPAGPLYGKRCLPAEGEPGAREAAVLQAADITPDDFNIKGLRLRGARRPYRIPLQDVALTWDEGLVISFTLPPGGYATMVMREIMKND